MKKRLSVLAAAVAVGATSLLAPAAHAAAPTHCWVQVETGATGCYTTFDTSGGVVRTTGGPVSSSGRTAGATTATEEVTTLAAGSYIAAIMYEDAQYSGASVTYLVATPCDTNPDVDFQIANMGGWSDRVSSFVGYNNCQVMTYDDINFGGYAYGWYSAKSYVGDARNDRASSVRFA